MVRVRNSWLSVDPYMRGRMNDVKSYVPPFQVGEPMEGGAVGEVVESKRRRLRAGRSRSAHGRVARRSGRPGAEVNKLPDLGVAPEQFLGMLGVTGATAYFGLLDAASAKEGDIVFVSAAAGAVGSAVVQIAKAKGMTVIGSAGGEEKCEFVRSLGADQVIDYRAGPILEGACSGRPGGHRRLFRQCRRRSSRCRLRRRPNNARFAICGMIENYNHSTPPAFRFIARIIAARIGSRASWSSIICRAWANSTREMGPWIASGAVKSRETVVDGLENTPDAFSDCSAARTLGRCSSASRDASSDRRS